MTSIPEASETSHSQIETSLTLDYRRRNWGLDRIVLDALANHLPADSKGSSVQVQLAQQGVLRELSEADPQAGAEAIVFQDDGPGYDANLLSVLFSTKTYDRQSVGQFGEGLKLVAAAALREGIMLEYRSRNWAAVPWSKQESIDGLSIERLCFLIVSNGHSMQGSQTIFFSPPPSIIKAVFSIPEKVLHFNTNYAVLSTNHSWIRAAAGVAGSVVPHDRILQLQTARNAIFVKGMRLQEIESAFSYDLNTDDISPDRLYGNMDEALNRVKAMLERTTNPTVIETLLREAHYRPRELLYEYMALNSQTRMKPVGAKTVVPAGKRTHPWVLKFNELFGPEAVVADAKDVTVNTDARLLGYEPVEFFGSVAEFLSAKGALSAKAVAQGEKTYTLVEERALRPHERSRLELLAQVNALLKVPSPPRIQVYSSVRAPSGREIETNPASYNFETKTVNLRRSALSVANPANLLRFYLHELGHHVTGKLDYDRVHSDFGFEGMAKLLAEKLSSAEYSPARGHLPTVRLP